MTLEETNHSMTRRRSGWDYCAPADYMVTLTLADRSSSWPGRLEPRPGPGPRPAGKPAGKGGLGWLAAGVALTALGEAVAQKWLELPSLFPGVETREYTVMPEHFHGIIMQS